jgi:hypothetical protein
MEKDECRFCGSVTSPENIKIKLDSDMQGEKKPNLNESFDLNFSKL